MPKYEKFTARRRKKDKEDDFQVLLKLITFKHDFFIFLATAKVFISLLIPLRLLKSYSTVVH
jgi:hypothetical protein